MRRALPLCVVFLACTAAEYVADDASSARPHILLILADDLGHADLGFTGCSDFPTPHLDRLAAEGVRCSDGHVSASVCAPSRAGLLTGRYQQRSGFECNLGGNSGLLAGTDTFPLHLAAAGYETALVGKWHLGASAHNHPSALGFEHFTGLLGGSRSYFPTDKPPGRQRRVERDGVPVPEDSFAYLTDLFTDEGVRRIEERDPERPLLLFMSYTAPHGPMHARADLLERFAAIENPRRRKYAAMVTALDEGVGRLRAALEREGMADDTLIVFLSDNGGATNNASDNGRWRGMKGSKWEGGQRVPFVLHWPEQLAPGTYDRPVSSLDLAGTFLAAAGAAPLSVADGVDLVPHLQGRSQSPPHTRLFWRRAVAAAVREGDWKLIRVEAEDGGLRAPILVDLASDPAELVNRAPSEPARVAQLSGLLEAWERSLLPPRWLTEEIWRDNQRKKHAMELVGREAERELPESEMKAIVNETYGTPDVLELREVERPVVADGDVLVRVHASCVSAGDWHMLSATWFAVRLFWGLFRPRRKILGFDVSGTVEAVGPKVTRFGPGDEVFGASDRGGAFAEYMCAPEGGLAKKPARLTHEQAAAVPTSALTALHGLRDKGRIRPGHRVLINGASGGVGTYAVQIAKSFGAEVTGVCSTEKLELVQSIGADHTIDYRRQDFTSADERYDLVLDNVGNRPLADCKRTLTPEGIYVAVSGHPARALWIALAGGKRMVAFVSQPDAEDLGILAELLEAGKLTPVIERSYPLSEVPEAMRYYGEGRARGKLVISVLGAG